jgi:hypothetical protein
MKALKLLLKSEGIDTDSLRVLFEQDGATTFALTEDGWDVLDLWLELRDLVPRTGRWPLLVGDDYPTNRGQFYSDGKEPTYPHYRKFLEKAERIDFAAWLAEQREAQIQCIREELAHADDDDEKKYFTSLLKGDEEFHGIDRDKWPRKAQPYVFEAIAFELKFTDDMDSKDTTVALLPVKEGWKAPAIMKWGGWNANPYADLHCAALRYWEQQYGAELVAMTKDELEFRVTKPPRTKKEAMRLAAAQFHYCGDRIGQGEGSLEELAAKLLRADAWYFWWD